MEGHSGTDIFIVLVAALKVINMCCQMGIDNAETGVVENKPNCYSSFVSLKKRISNEVWHSPENSLFSCILSYLQPQNKTLAAIMEAFHTSQKQTHYLNEN